MNREDIIRMAQEAGMIGTGQAGNKLERLYQEAILDALPRFAKLVATAEREACIQLLEDFSKTQMVPVKDTWRMGLIAGANAIRVRGRE